VTAAVEGEDHVVVGQRVPETAVPDLLPPTRLVLVRLPSPVVVLGIGPAGDDRGRHGWGPIETIKSHDKISPCY